MTEPKISIIVPIYKIEKFLPQCLDSIKNQTYSNLDIVLVDDGSTGSCAQMCDDFAKDDIRVRVVHKKNGGLVSARKAGLKVSTGDYICHVDGDDWLHPKYVESFVPIICKYGPEIICSGEITAYPGNEIHTPMRERIGYYDKSQIYSEIVPSLLEREDGYYFNHSIIQKCIKRELAITCENLVDDSISMSEDHAFIVPAVLGADSLYIMEECLYYYRMNPSSMTKVKKSLPWSYPKLMSTHFLEKVDLTDLCGQYFRVMFHILFNTVISQFNQEKSYKVICREINEHLSQYSLILEKVYYTSLSRKIAVFALRHRLFFLLKLYALKRYR